MLENMRKVQERVDALKKGCAQFCKGRRKQPDKTFASELSKAQGIADPKSGAAAPNVKPSPELQKDIDLLVDKHSKEHKIEPEVVRKLIAIASGFNPEKVGKEGQLGLMQVKPEIFREFGFTNPFDPSQNISAGTQYLSKMLQKNGGNLPLALAAYNTDPATVKRFGGIPPFADTQSFVSQILAGISDQNKNK
ncbi:MAG: hypothetical protein Kow0029_17240 [Candidatus Rifleibacteriota bacterium]